MSDADIDDVQKFRYLLVRIAVAMRFPVKDRHTTELWEPIHEAFERIKRIEQRQQQELPNGQGFGI